MQVLKGYVFRLYPNKEQQELINKTIGSSRFVYNHFLEDKIKDYKETKKTKSAYDQIKLIPNNSIKLDLKNKVITLPKLKEVKIRGYRNKENIIGNTKSAVIKREAGKYYVSVLIEEPLIRPSFNPKSIIGLDLDIKDLIVTSHNEKIENNIKINTKRMKGLQKGLSRCQKGSKNRYKLRLKIYIKGIEQS